MDDDISYGMKAIFQAAARCIFIFEYTRAAFLLRKTV